MNAAYQHKILVRPQGFTLIELMIVIAVIAILAAIAFPAYQNYMHRSFFNEVIQATAPYKAGVERCYQAAGSPATVSGCAGGSRGVPTNISSSGNSNLANIATSSAGVITATAAMKNGLNGETYILTPKPTTQTGNNKTLSWSVSGTCMAAGYC